jgi:hypothetical protein
VIQGRTIQIQQSKISAKGKCHKKGIGKGLNKD